MISTEVSTLAAHNTDEVLFLKNDGLAPESRTTGDLV
jgi:hypothetical protein